MDIRTKIGSQKFIKVADLAGRATALTIAEVVEETVGQGRDAEDKVVLYFTETDKGLVLNSTNANTIADFFGFETGQWLDGKIELFPTTTDFAGKTVECIRVRKPTAAAQQPAAATPAAPVAVAAAENDACPF